MSADRIENTDLTPKVNEIKYDALSLATRVDDIIPKGTPRVLFIILLAQKILSHQEPEANFKISSPALKSRLTREALQPINQALEEEKRALIDELLQSTPKSDDVFILVGNLRMLANEFYAARKNNEQHRAVREKWSASFESYLQSHGGL